MFPVDHAEDAAVGTLVRVVAGQEHSAIGFDRQKAFDYLKGFERMVGEYDVALVDRRTGIDEYAITGFERWTHRIAVDPQSEPPAQQHIEPLAKPGNGDLVAHRKKKGNSPKPAAPPYQKLRSGKPGNVLVLASPENAMDLFDRFHEFLSMLEADLDLAS